MLFFTIATVALLSACRADGDSSNSENKCWCLFCDSINCGGRRLYEEGQEAFQIGDAIAGTILSTGSRRNDDEAELRRLTKSLVQEANEEICEATNSLFEGEHLTQLAITLTATTDNESTLESLAQNVIDWCSENASEGRRRLGDRGDDMQAQFRDWVMAKVEKLDAPRRRLADGENQHLDAEEDASLSAHMYQQCVGYATVLKMLIKNGNEDGALVFGASSHGSSAERTNGCGSVVGNVNDAIKDEEVNGLWVEEDQGVEIVAVNEDLAKKLGSAVTAITLTSGVVLHKLMNLCHFYD